MKYMLKTVLTFSILFFIAACGGGGGGGGSDGTTSGGGNYGASGAVRLIWAGGSGLTRTFPSTNTGNL